LESDVPLVLLLLLALLPLPSLAQGGLVFLPSDQFGKVVVRLPQSAGGLSLVQLQNVLGRNANFEPLSKPSSREWSGEYRDNRFAMRISARATSPQSRDVHQWEYEWTGGALQRLPRQRIGLEGALFSFPKGSKMKSRSCEGALSVLEG
jgi:hypothetical protein